MSKNEVYGAKGYSARQIFRLESNFVDELCSGDLYDSLCEITHIKLNIINREVRTKFGIADIVCVNPKNDKLVVIEVCFDNSDADHLRRLILYAIDLKCETAIFIAEEFNAKTIKIANFLNKHEYYKLNLILVEIKVATLMSKDITACTLKNVTNKLISNFTWEYSTDDYNTSMAHVRKISEIISKKIDVLPIPIESEQIVTEILETKKLEVKNDYVFISWSNEDSDNCFIFTIYKILTNKPKHLIICVEEDLCKENTANLTNIAVIAKRNTFIRVFNMAKINSNEHDHFEIDIYKKITENPTYIRHRKRGDFWHVLNDYYFEQHKSKYTAKRIVVTGEHQFVAPMPYKNVTLVVIFNRDEKKFEINLRIFDKESLLAYSRYAQIYQYKQEITKKVNELNIIVHWRKNLRYQECNNIIRFTWNAEPIQKDHFGDVNLAKTLADQLIKIEMVLYPYVKNLRHFVT